jgi:hypothetical protein
MLQPGIDNTLILVALTYLFVLPIKNLVLLRGERVEFKKLATIFGRLNNKYVINIVLLYTLTVIILAILDFFGMSSENLFRNFIGLGLGVVIVYLLGKYVKTTQIIAEYTSESLGDESYNSSTSLYMFTIVVPLLVMGFFTDSLVAGGVISAVVLYLILNYFGFTGSAQRRTEVYTILNEEL